MRGKGTPPDHSTIPAPTPAAANVRALIQKAIDAQAYASRKTRSAQVAANTNMSTLTLMQLCDQAARATALASEYLAQAATAAQETPS